MRFPRRGLAAALAVVVGAAGLTAACSDSLATAPAALDARGSYVLRSVNAQPLPVFMSDIGGKRVELVAGELSISSSLFSQLLTFRETVSAQTSHRQSLAQGEVSVDGSRIRFRVFGGGEFEGTLAGNRLEYTIQGNNGPLVFLFEKS
ncbi:MAG TPA: hypothetical protein VF746_22810 [Longimicrobium sp.]|jgi:ABC-type amino acid transport substrate-binding protein